MRTRSVLYLLGSQPLRSSFVGSSTATHRHWQEMRSRSISYLEMVQRFKSLSGIVLSHLSAVCGEKEVIG
jgi:hypothetical protein